MKKHSKKEKYIPCCPECGSTDVKNKEDAQVCEECGEQFSQKLLIRPEEKHIFQKLIRINKTYQKHPLSLSRDGITLLVVIGIGLSVTFMLYLLTT